MALISTEYSRELLSSLTLSSEAYKTLKLTCDCGLFVAQTSTDLMLKIIYSVQVSIQEKQEREWEQNIVRSLTWAVYQSDSPFR